MKPDHYAKLGALFGSILTWRLKHGSHEFPGPDGGTCINEAAIVAAGFPYCAVQCADDCPECFSRPISEFSIALNDLMPFAIRQKLMMPFVLRLAGTDDIPSIEMQREAFIVEATKKMILPIAYPGVEFGDETSLPDALEFLMETCAKNKNFLHAHYLQQAHRMMYGFPINAITACAHVAHAVGRVVSQPTAIYREAVAILDNAILLGRHQDLEPIAAEQHMRAIRQDRAKQRKPKQKQLADAIG